jgi:proteasome assembly chaperone 3
MSAEVVHGAPYPAKTKTATGTVNGIATEAEVTHFSDKIMVLVSQGGRLAQWVSDQRTQTLC